jgi:hypothetical protein
VERGEERPQIGDVAVTMRWPASRGGQERVVRGCERAVIAVGVEHSRTLVPTIGMEDGLGQIDRRRVPGQAFKGERSLVLPWKSASAVAT